MEKHSLDYSLMKEDYLIFQLYAASQSKRIRRARLANWLVLPAFNILLFAYSISRELHSIIWLIIITTVVWIAFYPFYSKYKYRKHYSNYINENYKNRVGIKGTISFDEEYFYLYDEVSESKLKIEELKEIVEIKDYFFIRNKQDLSIIIPKSKDESNVTEEFIKRLENALKIERIKKIEWKWK